MGSAITYFKTTSKIAMGIGAVSTLPDDIKLRGGKRVLIITDEGVAKAGVADKIRQLITSAGLEVKIFNSVPPEPPMEIIAVCLAAAKQDKSDFIVGLGGGSSMDVSKVVSVMMTNDQPLEALVGTNLVKKRGVPTILIPTTAGTGSEVTPVAILTDTKEQLKKSVVSDYLFPEVAILDAALTESLPPHQTAASGMDALIHAVEAYTSINAMPYTDHLAERAMRLITANIRSAWAYGKNMDARMKMLEGSLLAGQAFANAGVTAVHAFSYPLGGEFHVAHGVANTLMLCPVMRYNMIANIGKFAQMASVLCPHLSKEKGSLKEIASEGISALEELAGDLNLPLRLRDINIPEQAIDRMSAAMLKCARPLGNNPRTVGLEDAKKIYREAY